MSRAIVVVPCYNEAQRLELSRFDRFLRHSIAVDFVFVDDGSDDQTLGLLERLYKQHPLRCSVLRLVRNSGKAEAVRQGFLVAFQARPDYVGFWDADLATPLEEAVKFCGVLDRRPDIDIVVGTRIQLLGHAIDRRPLRRALGRLFARTASLVLGINVYDTQCGAKLFRFTPLLRRAFAHPFSSKWIFDVELLARLLVARRQTESRRLSEAIYECPLDAWQDVAGSKIQPKDFFRAIGEMARIYWLYLRRGALRVAQSEKTDQSSQEADMPALRPIFGAPQVADGPPQRGRQPAA